MRVAFVLRSAEVQPLFRDLCVDAHFWMCLLLQCICTMPKPRPPFLLPPLCVRLCCGMRPKFASARNLDLGVLKLAVYIVFRVTLDFPVSLPVLYIRVTSEKLSRMGLLPEPSHADACRTNLCGPSSQWHKVTWQSSIHVSTRQPTIQQQAHNNQPTH